MSETSPFYAAVGIIILGGTTADLLWTTVWAEGGAGPLTKRLMSGTWRILRGTVNRRSKLLTLSGPLILIISLVTWTALLWLGWTLIFAGVENAITATGSSTGVSWTDRLYFVGYSFFTLGNGGFSPNGVLWQITTVLTTASGMLFVTLVVTYVLSVLGAVTQKQLFASTVSGLGQQSEAVVKSGWDGEEFGGFDLPLNTISTKLNQLTVNHMAYPILHYFYTQRRQYAAVSSVAVLDDSLTLLRFGVSEEARPSAPVLRSARSSVKNYLDMVDEVFVRPEETPPPPDLNTLREAGVPTVSEEEFADALNGLEGRRRKLYGLADADARTWPSNEST